MEYPEDAALCQHLLRTRAVPVEALLACREAQRRAREQGAQVPGLRQLLVARGLLPEERADQVERAARGKTAKRARKRAGSSSGRYGPRRAEEVSSDVVSPGDRLGGYEVQDRVARGSMGTVYRAQHLRSGDEVALKVLAPERAEQDTAGRRFVQEARLACALSHPGLVRGRAFGVDRGRRFFVMEYFPAPSLRSRIQQGGALPEPEAARVGAQVARALQYLHAQEIVHRDVKPANILVGPGETKLCDLGLARELSIPSQATASGATLGTPRYMSPEQARGSRDVGPAADLYSLGVTLFHAVAGRPPFLEESGIVVLSRHLFDEVPDVRAARAAVSQPLAELIWRLTRKDPAQRLCSALEAALALEALASPQAVRLAA